MMMESVFWWRKPEYPEETTDLRLRLLRFCYGKNVEYIQWWAQLTKKLASITGNPLTEKLASITLNR